MKHSILKYYKQTKSTIIMKTLSHSYELYFDSGKAIMMRIDDEKFNIFYDDNDRVSMMDGNRGTIFTVVYPNTDETVITNVIENISWNINTSLCNVTVITNNQFPNILYNILFDRNRLVDFTYEDLNKVGVR